MNAPVRLGLYAVVLLALFGLAAGIGSVVVPDPTVAAGPRTDAGSEHGDEEEPESGSGHGSEESGAESHAAPVRGLGLAEGGFVLSEVGAPTAVGTEGVLSFRIAEQATGTPLTRYQTAHEKELHLIVVRTDGSEFRHVHPRLAADGTWSIDWQWERAGSYRVFADFVPADTGESLTLTRTVDVAGALTPTPTTEESRTDAVDGFQVTLSGALAAATESTLTAEVTRDGEPVTDLQPYLGAYGHLVALRQGDLAYLHVHPIGEEPEPGTTSGPTVAFGTEVPTPGRYLLYLDFQVDSEVHTATFVVDAK